MNTKEQIIQYVNTLAEEKLEMALDYMKYLHWRKFTPLDEFDYELARRADESKDEETISFDELLEECGLTYADLQN